MRRARWLQLRLATGTVPSATDGSRRVGPVSFIVMFRFVSLYATLPAHPTWNALSGRQQSPPDRRRPALPRVPGHFRAYSRCPWPERRGVRQGGQDLSALRFGHHRAAFALDPAHALIRVQRHHQLATERLGAAQVADVANVQQIEAAVRQDNLLASRSPIGDAPAQHFAGKNFVLIDTWHLALGIWQPLRVRVIGQMPSAKC